MKFTAQQIADILQGEVVGNPDIEVSKLSKIEEGTEGALTFLANSKYNAYIYSTKASIAIVNKSFIPDSHVQATLIKVDDAYKSFSKLLEYYNEIKILKPELKVQFFYLIRHNMVKTYTLVPFLILVKMYALETM